MDAGSLPHPQQPPPPSPSPTWADVARGGHGGGKARRGAPGRGQLPPAGRSSVTHSTPAPPPRHVPTSHTPSPTASTQFEAWLRCRKEGCPARLVLETDGVSEEVSLWFRTATAVNPAHTAGDKVAPLRRRRSRPERDRRRRRLRVERRQAARSNAPPTSVVATAATDNGQVPPAEGLGESSPPAGSPPAKRPRTRAAARSGGRLDQPTPEKSRAAEEASPCPLHLDLDLSVGTDQALSPVSPPSPPPPPPSPLDPIVTEASVADGSSLDSTVEKAGVPTPPLLEPDFHEELWEDGHCLNTRNPPWKSVFYPRGPLCCRFCKGEPMPNDDENDDDFVCKDCNDLSTFQLVVKYAPRWRYFKK